MLRPFSSIPSGTLPIRTVSCLKKQVEELSVWASSGSVNKLGSLQVEWEQSLVGTPVPSPFVLASVASKENKLGIVSELQGSLTSSPEDIGRFSEQDNTRRIVLFFNYIYIFLLLQKSMLECSTKDFRVQVCIVSGDSSGRRDGIKIQVQAENGMLNKFWCKEASS